MVVGLAEVSNLPDVMTYGVTREEALMKVKALAFRVMAERLTENKNWNRESNNGSTFRD